MGDFQRMSSSASEEISLRELFDLVWSGRWVIAAVAIGFLCFGVFYALISTPIYSADGLVQVEQEDKSLASSLDNLSMLLEGGGAVQTPAEIAIINSRMVLGEVAEQLRLRIVAKPHTFPIVGDAIFRFRSQLDAPADPVLGLASYAWGGEKISITAFEAGRSSQDQIFTLLATENGFDLLDPDGNKVLDGKVGVSSKGKTIAGDSIRIFVQSLVARPGTRFDVMLRSEQKMFDYMADRLSVTEQSKDSGIIQISYLDESPHLVAKVVSSIEEAYLRQNVERRSEEAQQSLDFLNRQLPEVRAKVDKAQEALNAYQSKEGSADVQKETEIILDQAVNLETQRLALTQQREAALQQFTPKHPVIVGLDEQIGSLDSEIAKIKGRVEALPLRQQEIFSLMRDLDVNTQLYTALLNSSQELQVTKAGTVGNVRIIDKALLPNQPSKPNKSLIVLASTILGGLAGVALIFLQRALLQGVDRPEEIERTLGLPTYASIPFSSQQKKLADEMRKRRIQNGILASLDGADLSIEALRSLRTSLHFAMLEATNNVLMLTSPAPNIGKSFISMNLGAVLALSGKTVVVVDGDLRRGRLHDYVRGEASPGVSEVVAGLVSSVQVMRSTSVEGLTLISRGAAPPNPAEILLNGKFVELIESLSKTHDYVIVDTPPVLPVADPSIVGRLAGTTFVVLKAAEHPMRTIEETVRRLNTAGVDVRGVLFNQVGAKVGSHGYGYYGYSYGYGGYAYARDAEKR